MPTNGWLRHDQTLRIVLIYLSLLVLSVSMLAETVNGFVTRIDSPTEIEIGTIRALITSKTRCNFEALPEHTRSTPAMPLSQCNSAQMTIGSRVKLTGQFTKGGQFVASEFVMLEGYDPGESRLLLMYRRPAPGVLVREALNEEAPTITKSTQGWNGMWWIDGYPMTVNTQTRLLSSPDSEMLAVGGHLVINGTPIHAKHYKQNVHELNSSRLLTSNTWTLYHARHGLDGTLTASQIRLWPNQATADWKQFLAMYVAKVKLPDYGKSMPGTLQYEYGEPIQIVPNQAVQESISRIGMMLVPKYQKELPTSDPTKINFKFYVVHSFIYVPKAHFLSVDGHLPRHYSSAYRYNAPKPHFSVTSVIAVPDGTILVPDVTLAQMQSQTQVMALLSYAITAILQKQAYIACGGDVYDCLRNEKEQLIRIGIRQMYLAGYDIREAPYAWAVEQGEPVNNPVKDSKHPEKEIPWYAAYAFNYISQYYKDVDYSKLKRGEKEYQQFLQELYKADPSLKRP